MERSRKSSPLAVHTGRAMERVMRLRYDWYFPIIKSGVSLAACCSGKTVHWMENTDASCISTCWQNISIFVSSPLIINKFWEDFPAFSRYFARNAIERFLPCSILICHEKASSDTRYLKMCEMKSRKRHLAFAGNWVQFNR